MMWNNAVFNTCFISIRDGKHLHLSLKAITKVWFRNRFHVCLKNHFEI